MPKMTLEFNLPEEKSEMDMTLRAGDMHGILHDWDQELRKIVKYGDEQLTNKPGTELMEELRQRWFQLLREYEYDPYN